MALKDLTEQNFGYNEFNKANSYTGMVALAKLIQNLLITEPGTLPSCPKYGVGIDTYRMEFSNSDTYSKIISNISEQIDTYLADYSQYVKEVVIEAIPEQHLAGGGNGIYIGVILTETNDATGSDFTIVFSNVNNNLSGSVVTKFTII